MASTSASLVQKSFKYDVFLSFRGEDTRKTFVDHLYHALVNKGIITYKDDETIEKGERINEQLIRSIEESRFYIIIFSKNYASSSWCLEELVKIMECQKMTDHTAYPIFYDVEPTEIRNLSGAVGEAFEQFTRKRKRALEDVDLEKEVDVGRWRNALKEAASLAGMELKNTFNGNEAEFIQKIVEEVSLKLHFFNSSIDRKLVGMETRVRDVVSSLEIASDDVRMIGIKGMGGGGKTTLARAVFDHISFQFEGKSFVENVREVSRGSLSGLKKLQKQVLKDLLKDQYIDVTSVCGGINMMKKMMGSRKVIVVLDDVDDIGQLEALAGEPAWFKRGSRIIITTRDEQVLKAHQVNFIHDVNLLSAKEAICLFSRYAFGREIPNKGYEELSGMVVHYASGLPLTIKVLGSFLYGRDEGEWTDTIERLKTIPLKETLEKLELSYKGLENDQKDIFLYVTCILKGFTKKKAIRVLESCGFHARIGLRVLEQKSLISISEDDYHYYCDDSEYYDDDVDVGDTLSLHDHIEEMGMNIVRRLHPHEPKRHSRLWIKEEIQEILDQELGTEDTKCIKLLHPDLNPANIMNGLRKMQNLSLLFVEELYDEADEYDDADEDEEDEDDEDDKYDEDDEDGEADEDEYGKADENDEDVEADEDTQYLPNALQFLYWRGYPFNCLPTTFQANKLVNLEMAKSNISELWKGGERKVLNRLKFLNLSNSKLRTFDLTMTPHLEELNLKGCCDFVELQLPVECPKLKILNLSGSKVGKLNLRMTPCLEHLNLEGCVEFVELQDECQNLKILNLNDSKVSKLNLGMTPHLERLHLEKCYFLQEIKAPVGCLKKLVYLRLRNCLSFVRFYATKYYDSADPDSAATLNIDAACLYKSPRHPGNNLSNFLFCCTYKEPRSSWSGNLENLISIDSRACRNLECLLTTISCLQHLRELTLDGSIPGDQWQLESLEKLTLLSSEIGHLPDSICMLKHLKSLFIGRYEVIEHIPENICRLECLEELSVVYCTSLQDIPTSICNMKCLKALSLCGCVKVEKLPEELGTLERLEKLELNRCTSLRDIRNDICKMKCLKELNIEGAGISHLPQSIYQMKSLRIIGLKEQLESCGFTSSTKAVLNGWECHYVDL